MIKVVAKNYITIDKINDCITLVKELVQKTKTEKGCISYEMYQDTKDERILTMIETWENEEALQDHLESPHFKQLVPQIGKMSMRPTDMNIYRKVL